MSEIFRRYFTVVVACIGLLLGLQLPNLVDQYEKRVDAHLREVLANFKPIQEVANKYTNGSIEQLIEMHRKSDNKAFQDEGTAIENIYHRKLRFEAEADALKTGLAGKILHVLFRHDSEILDETLAQYSYTVPLNQDALIVGAVVAALMVLALELLLAVGRFLFR